MSGVYLEDVPVLKLECQQNNLSFQKLEQKDNWCAILCTKNQADTLFYFSLSVKCLTFVNHFLKHTLEYLHYIKGSYDKSFNTWIG